LLWARVATFLGQLMTRLWQLDALDGDTITDAFSVRCDRGTMTQNDLDNGRLVAEVSFNAAATIELIRVTLAVETSGTSAQSIAALAEAS
jgi:phage tail sheath protein FI